MGTREIKIQYLISIFFSSRGVKIPAELRLFIIQKNGYLRVYHGNVEEGHHAPDFRPGHELSLDRGKILDFFAKLEFLVNELYFLRMMPNDFLNGYILDKILERVDFFGRITILKEIGVINQPMYESILKIKDVRNGFAHLWGESEVKYRNKLLKSHFEVFKADAERVWEQLEELYIKEQVKIDIDRILKQIENLNKT